jgi:catechol 2,3-dioxygenase-like lactoylglutathione lyase family enzyme
MLRELSIAVLRVDDWERAVGFYRDTLGLAPEEVDREGGWARFSFPGGGATLAVFRRREGEPAGLFLNILSDDLEADAARFPVREPAVPGRGYRTAWVADPEGVRHQLFSWDRPRP